MHTHACHVCGESWDHASNSEATTEQFNAAHTCPNGHEVTVKYTKEVARGIAEVCKAGGDVMAYLSKADPVAAVTLEGEKDLELRDALDAMRDGGPIFGEIAYQNFTPALQAKVDAYADKLNKAVEAVGHVNYEH